VIGCRSAMSASILRSLHVNMAGPAFHRYIGIDYSGAQTPTSSLPGLRVYVADRDRPPQEVEPPPSPRKYWTRREFAEDGPTIVES
jgi:hypothetical protein